MKNFSICYYRWFTIRNRTPSFLFSFTVALDLKITDDLRRACVARELVNRIQNRRKEQGYAITDKIEVTLFSASEVFKQAVAENEAYIAGETQALVIKWAAVADGLEVNDVDGETFAFTTVKANQG